ncbi:MAG: hypothetical protein JWL76_1444 [Thermoleophilia bacterium]|nr:hypothetical protein [Thermoleophilia bacterium]
MLEDLDSADEIKRLTRRLLDEAGAAGRLPTPVDDIIEAAGLHQPSESIFDLIESAPAHLQQKLRGMRHKVQAALDRRSREIYVNPDIHVEGKRRFNKLHEVSHDIYPWQQALIEIDTPATLSWQTQQTFEREANQGAAELLFQRELFRSIAADYEVGFAPILELAETFGASIHATFRRYVESHRRSLCGLVLDVSPVVGAGITGFKRREAVASARWTRKIGSPTEWPDVLEAPPYSFVSHVAAACAAQGGMQVPFGYPNLRGEQVALNVHLFSNSYSVFVLIWRPQRQLIARRRTLAGAVVVE